MWRGGRILHGRILHGRIALESRRLYDSYAVWTFIDQAGSNYQWLKGRTESLESETTSFQ